MDIPRQQKPNRRKYVYASAAVLGLVFVTVALGRLEPAAPSVDRAVLWIDTVKQGTIPREVRASGTLVPESITWIPAVTGGRIDQIHARPGAAVTPETIILELTNPDVQLEALSAQQQLEQAEALLVTLENDLETQRLNQEAAVATARTQHNEAKRNEGVFLSLDSQKLASVNEVEAAKERAVEAAKRLQIEEDRLRLHNSSAPVRLDQQRKQIQRLRSIAQFQQNRIASMKVRAGVAGVLQEMTWEPGQWVNSGQILAKVSEPGRLKAVLRVQENQARDVVVGLDVKVDPRLDSRAGTIPGRVMRIDPASVSGSVLVEVQLLAAELPRGARPDLSVDGVIEIDRLEDVKYVGRPLIGQPESTVGLFRLEPDGRYASRANVKFGRASVNTIEVLQGLDVGDRVIISDMSQYDNADRVRIR